MTDQEHTDAPAALENDGGLATEDPGAAEMRASRGTYDEADFSVAAQRSRFHIDQHAPAAPSMREPGARHTSGCREGEAHGGPAGGPGSVKTSASYRVGRGARTPRQLSRCRVAAQDRERW